MSEQLLLSLGAVLIFAGFLMAFVAVILMFLTQTSEEGKVKGGGAVIIGFFPIVFGTDRESLKRFLLLSLAIIGIILIVTLVFHFVLK
jgi:uncharacterized protein (TIGR00304 family)